jgi:MFS family permease
MPLYLVRDLHYGESFLGGLFALNTLIIVAIEIPLNVSTAHWPTRPAMALATVLVAIGFGLLGVVRAALPIALTVVFWTFGEMIFFPTATAYVAELAPPGRTGEYMGAFASTFSLALIVGPWLGATMLDHVGPAVTWGTMFVIGLFAASLTGLARSREPSAVTAVPD